MKLPLCKTYFHNQMLPVVTALACTYVAPDESPPVISVWSGVVTGSRSLLGEFPALSMA